MKKKIRIIIILVLAISLLSFLSVSIYGAYYGRGIFKDVFVNRKYIFGSDYLVESTNLNKASENKIHTVNDIVNVHVYNYDVSSGEYDNFDIKFDVYAWVSDTSKTINIELDGELITLNSTEATCIKSDVLLEKDKQDSKIISIRFGASGVTDLSTIPTVYVAVVSKEPSFLANKVLCACFQITSNDEFSIDSYFDYKTGDSTSDYAAFKYYIVVSGQPESDYVTVNYNSTYLSVSSWSINSNVIKTSEGTLKVMISKDEMLTIVFIRTENSFWDNELTFENGWNELENLVTLIE